jgi:hypothetical protein
MPSVSGAVSASIGTLSSAIGADISSSTSTVVVLIISSVVVVTIISPSNAPADIAISSEGPFSVISSVTDGTTIVDSIIFVT